MINIRKYIVGFAAFVFLLSNATAAKLPNRGYYYDYIYIENTTYEDNHESDMLDLLTRENASYEDPYIDYNERTPFEEEIAMQTMAGPPGFGDGPGNLYSIPGGLLTMLGFACAYAIRLYRKKRQAVQKEIN